MPRTNMVVTAKAYKRKIQVVSRSAGVLCGSDQVTIIGLERVASSCSS